VAITYWESIGAWGRSVRAKWHCHGICVKTEVEHHFVHTAHCFPILFGSGKVCGQPWLPLAHLYLGRVEIPPINGDDLGFFSGPRCDALAPDLAMAVFVRCFPVWVPPNLWPEVRNRWIWG